MVGMSAHTKNILRDKSSGIVVLAVEQNHFCKQSRLTLVSLKIKLFPNHMIVFMTHYMLWSTVNTVF